MTHEADNYLSKSWAENFQKGKDRIYVTRIQHNISLKRKCSKKQDLPHMTYTATSQATLELTADAAAAEKRYIFIY